jgi:hypothetical protein
MGNDLILSLIWGVIALISSVINLLVGYKIGSRKVTVKKIYNYKVVEKVEDENDNIDFPNSRKK